MERYCDNKSVGVILKNRKRELALLKRARFPIGIAPAAGHIDNHGSPEQAAIDELSEELGITLSISALHRTIIDKRRVANECRRIGGDYHFWTIYEAETDITDLAPDPDETNGAFWYKKAALQSIADRTREYQEGNVDQLEWADNPGLEPVWVDFLKELGYIT